MKKIKLLFTIESLAFAGAEKSLLSLLNNIDCSKYQIDLQLFSRGGILEQQLPEYVNLLPEFDYVHLCKKSILSHLFSIKSWFSIRTLFSRIIYSLLIRILPIAPSKPIQEAVLFWKSYQWLIPASTQHYDVAIAYAQGIPTFYTTDKISADKKIAWVNSMYMPKQSYKKYISRKYNIVDKIVAVSPANAACFKKEFPNLDKVVELMPDITDANLVRKLSQQFIPSEYSESTKHKIRILTVGRLGPMKGHDIAIDAANFMKKQGISFHWYMIGIGALEKKLKDKVKELELSSDVTFLGLRTNPYPYFKECDIYVQPSRFEGFPITLTEAMILDKPIVATKFDSVHTHMKDGINCLLADIDGTSVAECIIKLTKNDSLKNCLIQNLKDAPKGNTHEIQTFYNIVAK